MSLALGSPPRPVDLDTRLRSAFRSRCVSLMGRAVPEDIETLIESIPVDRLPAIGAAGTPCAVAKTVRLGLSTTEFGPPQLIDWLCTDIQEVSAAFASAAGIAFVSVQLAPFIEDRHVDIDGLGHRVVTSYCGSEGAWIRPGILAFLPPEWPFPPGVDRQIGPEPGMIARRGLRSALGFSPTQRTSPPCDRTGPGRLLLSIDDYGRC